MEQVINPAVEDGFEDEPYESITERKVIIQPYDYAVRTLMDMVTEGELILDPDYQRNYRWSDEKASRFIESISLNIPVPVVYLAEEKDGAFSVIDGQQRLTSLFRFMRPAELVDLNQGETLEPLELTGLKVRADLNGKTFTALARQDKSTLAKRPIRCIVVLNESDSTLKFEVFERLNTGSVSLTDQEVRNCIHRGSFNTLIKKLALNEKFQEMISLPPNAQSTMKDVELVLRFLAYKDFDERTSYSDSYTEYLNNYMEENREIGATVAKNITEDFESTINLIYKVLGPGKAFRKPLTPANEKSLYAHNIINGAIYESQMVAFSRLGKRPPSLKKLREGVHLAFNDQEYWSSLFSGTSKKPKVLRRSNVLTRYLTGA